MLTMPTPNSLASFRQVSIASYATAGPSLRFAFQTWLAGKRLAQAPVALMMQRAATWSGVSVRRSIRSQVQRPSLLRLAR